MVTLRDLRSGSPASSPAARKAVNAQRHSRYSLRPVNGSAPSGYGQRSWDNARPEGKPRGETACVIVAMGLRGTRASIHSRTVQWRTTRFTTNGSPLTNFSADSRVVKTAMARRAGRPGTEGLPGQQPWPAGPDRPETRLR